MYCLKGSDSKVNYLTISKRITGPVFHLFMLFWKIRVDKIRIVYRKVLYCEKNYSSSIIMATEIEHKYKVLNDSYLVGYTSAQYFRQGYLTVEKDCVVRVRIVGKKAFLTIKGKNWGCSRVEYELPIDLMTAQSMLDNLCHTPIIEKTRYIYFYAGHKWEIDRFHGANEGLVVAEIELQSEEELYELPPFVGDNVTGIPRYYNSCLVEHPYSAWDDADK